MSKAKQDAVVTPVPGGTSTLARTAPSGMVVHDELAGLELGADVLGDDGLSETDREDRKMTIYMINFGGMGKDGRAVPKDSYFNTVLESFKYEVDAVFLSLHKTRAWTKYNEQTKKTDTFCRSFDGKAGVMDNGTIRPCEGCPDWAWRTEPDEKTGAPKRMRNCGPIYNVASVDRETSQPFLIRYKRTSLPAFKNHLQKYHLDRRPLGGGKMGNYPLYVFGVKLRAELVPKAQHCVPIIESQGLLSRDEIVMHAANAKEIFEQVKVMIKQADAVEASSGEGGDTSFDTSKYSDASGDDFVPASGTPANDNDGE